MVNKDEYIAFELSGLVVDLKHSTPLPQVFPTIDFSIDTHWTDLTDSWPDHFIGFIAVLVLG